ncbi:MAG: energy transducer TonB [Lacunisphaera sp.]|nr:energy transducer TonB [Lacunisphaera sp.]
MKKLFVTALLAQLALTGPARCDSKPEKAVAAQNVIAQNAADFVAKLPPTVFVLVSSKNEKEEKMKELGLLGPTPNTEFFVLPPEAVKPKITRQGPPDYPRGAGPGKARIMALISASGEVTAVCCLAASQPVFAGSAARSVAGWKFQPAKLKDAPVPVLFTQLIEFNTEIR